MKFAKIAVVMYPSKDIHDEFGFPYDLKLDFDLEDPIRYYTSAGGIFYILLNGGDVVGTVAIKKLDERVAELKRMYLLPKYRGHGWGAKLLEHALAFCRDKGFESCVLDTNVKQESAQRLYASYGFETYKQEKNNLELTHLHKSVPSGTLFR
ncbi:MAG: GNAT family N-acetyltransferase [Candidatus Binatia bacterium]